MWEKQNGKCAICNEPETRKHHNGNILPLNVDHNHVNKQIRGLLCGRCNLLLGHADDRIDLLEKSSNYLQHWNSLSEIK